MGRGRKPSAINELEGDPGKRSTLTPRPVLSLNQSALDSHDEWVRLVTGPDPPRIENPPAQVAGYDPLRDSADCCWDGAAAWKVVNFFPMCLQHTKAFDGPFILEQWQSDLLATLFGWKRANGTRRYREAFIAVPRKNGKTNLLAGLGIYLLEFDDVRGPEVYCAAYSREQASLLFDSSATMVQSNPRLNSQLKVIPSTKRIVSQRAWGFMRAIPAEAGSSHGFSASSVLFDELHTQTNHDLYDVLKTSMGARAKAAAKEGNGGPLFLSITTAGHDRNSLCWEVWQRAKRVRDGVDKDPYFLPVIYEIAEDADWRDESVWSAVNPNLDVSTSLEHLREEYQQANDSPNYENRFRNWYLNEWTQQAIRWLPMSDWDACAVALPQLDGEPCWCGLDMSTVKDVTAFVMAFPLGERVAIVPHFWIPEATAEQAERTDRVPYRRWSREGMITLTPGRDVKQDFVRRDINELREKYAIQEIAADRWNAAQLLTELERDDGFTVVKHGQGIASMSDPSKALERLVISHNLIHGGHPILRWMAGNVAIEKDAAENIKPTKAESTGRIDGIVAAIMAVGRATTSLPAGSFYESNSLEMG